MALPKDPNEIAESNIRSENILAKGQPTEFAGNPNNDFVKLAGLGSLATGLMKKGAEKVLEGTTDPNFVNILKQVNKGNVSEPISTEIMQPTKVPSMQETGIVPDPNVYSEVDTKKLLGKALLSESGYKEFEEQGLTALTNQQRQQKLDADAALGMQKQMSDDEQLMKNMTVDAQKKPKIGLGSEERAERVRSEMKESAANLKSIDDGGDFNFTNIKAPDDLKAAIQATAEVFKDEKSAFNRGLRSQNQTMDDAAGILADESGFTRRVLRRRQNEGFSAEEMVAARMLLVSSAKKLADMAKEIELGNATDMDKLNFRRQMAIHAAIQMQVKGAQTEIARALNSFNIDVGPGIDPERAAALAKISMEGNDGDLTEFMANRVLAIYDEKGVEGINTFTREGYYQKSKKIIHELFLTSILSSPATQFKNIIGNASFMAYQLGPEIIAGMYGAARRNMFPDSKFALSEDQVFMQDAVIRFHGWQTTHKDALEAFKYAWKNEIPARVTKLDVDELTALSVDPVVPFARNINFLGRAARIPFRLLLGMDEYFKTISARGELQTRAHQRFQHALKMGKTLDEAADQAAMVFLDPKSFATEIEAKTLLDTQQESLGTLGKLTRAFQNTLVGRFILPFSTAPSNSMKNAALNTPGLQILISKKFRDDLRGTNGPQAHSLALGKMAFAQMTTSAIALAAIKGRMTGAMPRKQKDRDALPPNWKPYSFVIKGEGFPKGMPLYDPYTGVPNGPLLYVSYAGFEPVGGILGVTADTVLRIVEDHDNYQGGFDAIKNIGLSAGAATAQYYRELPMLQGMADVIGFVEAVMNENTDNEVESLLRGPQENFPFIFSSLQRSVTRAFDPKVYTSVKDTEYFTMQDIEEKIETPDGLRYRFSLPDGSPDYSMVGMKKDGTLLDLVHNFSTYSFNQATKINLQPLGLVDRDGRTQQQYDTLGRALGSNDISMANNPIATSLSFMTGIRMSQRQELSTVEEELMRVTSLAPKLGWPLSNPKSKEGIRFDKAVINKWVSIAKSEEPILDATGKDIRVKINFNDGAVTFQQALMQMVDPAFSNTTLGRQYKNLSLEKKHAFIQMLDQAYKDAAFDVLLTLPAYKNLRQVFEDKALLKAKAELQQSGTLGNFQVQN